MDCIRRFALLFVVISVANVSAMQHMPQPIAKAGLSVTVEGVPSDTGKVAVALFDCRESHLRENGQTGPQRTALLEIEDGTATVLFADLPPGRYSIAAYHDELGNDPFDVSILSILRGAFGFLSSRKGASGPRPFETAGSIAASVNLRDENTEVTIQMR
jgi:uncharacterized protein (DUF2141 family)|tara:strand:+ start:3956 stop:4432 length:477 start_codon:yes stop_codon:yes gene_type:complete